MGRSDSAREYFVRRALQLHQSEQTALYFFSLTPGEILKIADISRIARDDAGDLIGYQRPSVRQHIKEITEYLDGDEVLFPNPIILALSPSARFIGSRGPHVSDGLASSGSIEIPVPLDGERKPGWIVDGQQRALALSRSQRTDLAVPVSAFVTHSVDLQRDQFLRINNTKPLPRGLVTELLPAVSGSLPPRLSMRKTPSAVCDVLNQDANSPFVGLIRRPSTPVEQRRAAIVTDTSIVNMVKESFQPTGCLFVYRDAASGETDFDQALAALNLYWAAVRDTFPDAWGKDPRHSRLMHGAGIRAMGRLMDRMLTAVNPRREGAADEVRRQLSAIAPQCHWTSGRWETLGLEWNEIQNVPRHINELSNHLLRLHAALDDVGAHA
ncbi:DGQHR domain-containing protein [Ilumatobacter fluminis]|uniref:DGQHR domain-containing protein n=1 Tax=Ilumatobacter fluminis TaxID=467091 RepID=A0A4R7HVP2_9ACTN|nr:DGQHR domain-containing protein DpdB [Ilumatobacter fluminis]TDT14589.1 DGQHR domain-containing protein [Ilumatobacter fluminis]